MKEAINQLSQALTGKEDISNCTEDELRQMARLYPFFSPAHVLLAKKMKESGAEEEIALVQKASLYFSNRLWLEELLSDTGVSASSDLSREKIVATEPHQTVLEVPFTEEEVVVQVSEPEESPASPEPDAPEETATPSQPAFTETILETPGTTEEVVDQVSEVPSSEAKEMPPIKPLPGFASLKIEALDPGKMELSFEPYHTVDYFASQGIRFKEEEKPKDRLGYQLKSFTEWLKTLKKLPPSEIPATATRQEEKKVEQLAQVSITDREIVTEAMAEVWEMQGNAVKAVELYEKLSLLDPSKSSYFAAKIEHLKQL